MTHATRFVAVVAAELPALALCVPVQAQTPEIDALRVRAEAGEAYAQATLGASYEAGRGVPQDYLQAHMWFDLAASRMASGHRQHAVDGRDRAAGLMNPTQIAEAGRLAREWDAAHPRWTH